MTRHTHRPLVLLAACVVATSLLSAGCYTVSVDYDPLHAVSEPVAIVQLEIIDARPEDQGLEDGRVIGQYRGGFGIPQQVENGESGVMPSTVRAATVDALAGANIAVGDDAPILLEARVLQYWADGMMGIGSWVEVEYTLVDRAWQQTIEGQSGGGGAFSNQIKAVEEAVEGALVDLASQATTAFSSDAFQSAAAP